MINPPKWSKRQLDAFGSQAREHFVEARVTEPLELYLEYFDEYRGIVEEVLEESVDLTQFRRVAVQILGDRRKFDVFRYLIGPPISADDLKVLVQAHSLAISQIREDKSLVARLVGFFEGWHDRRRFPWLSGNWEPDERDRNAAILATTALLAMRKIETLRRNQSKEVQERLVARRLEEHGFLQVSARNVSTLVSAPGPGEFCRESMLGTRKADFLVGLWDNRTLAIECKVSNSSTNSIKRLNNDAAVKAVTWQQEFGTAQIVTAAVLAGVYATRNLIDAQQKGLTIFWAHDLMAMMRWIDSTNTLG